MWKYRKVSFLWLTAFPTVAPLTLLFLPSVVTAKLLYLICSQLITQSRSICLFRKYPRISGGWNRVMLFFPTFKFTKVEPLLECIPGKHRDLFWKIFPNNHFVKSLQIIDKFWLIPLVVFLNMAFNISKGISEQYQVIKHLSSCIWIVYKSNKICEIKCISVLSKTLNTLLKSGP